MIIEIYCVWFINLKFKNRYNLFMVLKDVGGEKVGGIGVWYFIIFLLGSDYKNIFFLFIKLYNFD